MIKRVLKAALTLASSLALLIATISVAGACFSFFHQPDVPEGLREVEDSE